MPDRSDVIYFYDGSFEGFLCCVFESYTRKEIPLAIHSPSDKQISIFPPYEIPTDIVKAERIKKSIPLKMGVDALQFLQKAFLTCLEQKELQMLRFMYLGYKYGPKVLTMLADDTVSMLYNAVKYLNNEAHRYQGFLRFSVHQTVMLATIQPKNYVLPILGAHFKDRFPSEKFLIHDQTHKQVCIYEEYKFWVTKDVEIDFPKPDQEEIHYRNLWRMFYNTIAIKERINPICRMNHMPKRYWHCMTEFTSEKEEQETVKSLLPNKSLRTFK